MYQLEFARLDLLHIPSRQDLLKPVFVIDR